VVYDRFSSVGWCVTKNKKPAGSYMRLIGTRESPWIQEKNVHWIAKAVFLLWSHGWKYGWNFSTQIKKS
jgi:hypothetical protein